MRVLPSQSLRSFVHSLPSLGRERGKGKKEECGQFLSSLSLSIACIRWKENGKGNEKERTEDRHGPSLRSFLPFLSSPLYPLSTTGEPSGVDYR